MKLIALMIAASVLPSVTLAQSRIQCVQGPDGEYVAALIWQNTLGVERANMICKMSFPAVKIDPQPSIAQTERGSRFDRQTYERAGKRAMRSYGPLQKAPVHAPDVDTNVNATQDASPSDYIQMW
jgi:hypothetical protein